jgi:hypothetical protein
MELSLARLRRGEAAAGLSGVALLVFLFAVSWFEGGSSGTTSTGWTGLPVLRWLILVTSVVAIALAVTQATRRAPAIPVTLSVFVTVLGAVTTVALILRMTTTGSSLQVGSWLGLLASIGVTVGGFGSIRQEDGWVPGPDHPIKLVPLGHSEHS